MLVSLLPTFNYQKFLPLDLLVGENFYSVFVVLGSLLFLELSAPEEGSSHEVGDRRFPSLVGGESEPVEGALSGLFGAGREVNQGFEVVDHLGEFVGVGV